MLAADVAEGQRVTQRLGISSACDLASQSAMRYDSDESTVPCVASDVLVCLDRGLAWNECILVKIVQ